MQIIAQWLICVLGEGDWLEQDALLLLWIVH